MTMVIPASPESADCFSFPRLPLSPVPSPPLYFLSQVSCSHSAFGHSLKNLESFSEQKSRVSYFSFSTDRGCILLLSGRRLCFFACACLLSVCGQRLFSCPCCSASFKRSEHLRRHVAIRHEGNGGFHLSSATLSGEISNTSPFHSLSVPTPLAPANSPLTTSSQQTHRSTPITTAAARRDAGVSLQSCEATPGTTEASPPPDSPNDP